MNLNYSINDLTSVFEFVKKNPNSTFDDWIKFNSKTLNDEEKQLFKFIEMCTIDVPSTDGTSIHLYVINWNGVGGGHCNDPFNVFLRKYFIDSYYSFNRTSYGEFIVITPDEDFFKIENYEEHKDFKGVYQKEITIGNVEILILNSFDLKCEDSYDNNFDNYIRSLERNHNRFWTEGYWDVFINDVSDLEFKPVLDLF